VACAHAKSSQYKLELYASIQSALAASSFPSTGSSIRFHNADCSSKRGTDSIGLGGREGQGAIHSGDGGRVNFNEMCVVTSSAILARAPANNLFVRLSLLRGGPLTLPCGILALFLNF
jgi:hypothetical protein